MTSSRFIFLGIGVALCAFATGCAPQLAPGTYGQEEKQWKSYIKDSYRNWDAPPALPPMVDPSEPKQATAPALSVLPAIDAPAAPIVIVEEGSAPVVNVFENVEIVPVPTMTRPEFYTVRHGDSLWAISRKFYGVGAKWQLIRDANPGVASNSQRLKVGTVLSIPKP